MEMRRRKLKPALTSASEAAAVLGNDDLLREILVRLDHPTCLVHAALVSKRWLRHASDPAFLRRFRGLHPPCLLGLYVHGCGEPSRFVPLPHPRELDVVFRRATFELGDGVVLDCRNGRALVFRLHMDANMSYEFNVCSPLHQTPHFRGGTPLEGGSHFFLPEDGGDGKCFTVVKLVCNGTKISAQHFVVRAGANSDARRTSAIIEAPSQWNRHMDSALLVSNKCYILGDTGYILGLDVSSMCLRVINLPDGVEQQANLKNIALSGADGSGFHLIHLKGFQIHIWHHDDSDDAGKWELVDNICVRQAIAHLAQSDYWEYQLEFWSNSVTLHRVADRAEFLLNLGREFFHMYIGSRKVEKVFEMPPDDDSYYRNSVIKPIMMVWPPSFPALSDEQIHQGQDE